MFEQTPHFWPSQNHNPANTEYIIYLYKRSLRNKQKHGLEEYELVTITTIFSFFFFKKKNLKKIYIYGGPISLGFAVYQPGRSGNAGNAG